VFFFLFRIRLLERWQHHQRRKNDGRPARAGTLKLCTGFKCGTPRCVKQMLNYHLCVGLSLIYDSVYIICGWVSIIYPMCHSSPFGECDELRISSDCGVVYSKFPNLVHSKFFSFTRSGQRQLTWVFVWFLYFKMYKGSNLFEPVQKLLAIVERWTEHQVQFSSSHAKRTELSVQFNEVQVQTQVQNWTLTPLSHTDTHIRCK
jgi:hypothetical protein